MEVVRWGRLTTNRTEGGALQLETKRDWGNSDNRQKNKKAIKATHTHTHKLGTANLNGTLVE